MNIKLSRNEIKSFVGDVLPLWLVSDKDLKFEKIKWSIDGDAVKMKSCSGCFHGAFNYGVFLTFIKAGEAKITASYDGADYVCRISSSERKKYSSDDSMNYYLGDFHAHTSHEHIHDKFLGQSESTQANYVQFIKDEGLRDVAVITDHSETIDLENFFRGFAEYDLRCDDMSTVVYPGCENEIMYHEKDRFGRTHRVSGELIVINANNFCQANTYPEFFHAFNDSPFAIGIFAHPHIIGISTMGVWDYKPRYQNVKEYRRLIKYVEVLNYPKSLGENVLHEYAYSDALDAGCRVSTTCGSDLHSEWNFNSYVGKTVIMAPEKTREAITDALLNLRAYACESENIKLRYSVNGKCAPCDLAITDKYNFDVQVGYFREDKSTRPIRCEVISDGGKTVKTIEGENFDSFKFEICSDTARWFYLRFVDSEGRRTWSPPVFCGREYDVFTNDGLKPIDKSGFKITDANGSDASALIDSDSLSVWQTEEQSCSLTVDMGSERSVSALGCYAVLLDIQKLRAEGIPNALAASSFPVDYRISVSSDGENYKTVAEGLFRAFAGEDIVRFDTVVARFVRLEVLSTTGSRYGKPPYCDAPLKIAELSIFE